MARCHLGLIPSRNHTIVIQAGNTNCSISVVMLGKGLAVLGTPNPKFFLSKNSCPWKLRNRRKSCPPTCLSRINWRFLGLRPSNQDQPPVVQTRSRRKICVCLVAVSGTIATDLEMSGEPERTVFRPKASGTKRRRNLEPQGEHKTSYLCHFSWFKSQLEPN